MVDRNKIIMNAFRDEIEKNAFFRKLVASIAGKVGKGALKVLKGISKKSKATSWAKNTAMDSGNIKSTLEASKKLVGKGDPGMFRRGFAKAQENLSTLITNPKKFGKRILNDIRYKTVDASKIVDGKIENNMFRKLFTGKTHRAVDSIGFHGGKQVIKRTPLGMLGTAGVTSGLGMGAFEFAGNGTDEQGNKRGLMNRLGRTAVETAKYTIAPGLAGVYDVGSFALSKVNEKAKKYKTDPLATMQSGRNNSINY